MSPAEVSEALGGGLLGLLGALLLVVVGVFYWNLISQIKEWKTKAEKQDARIEAQDKRLEELTRVVERQAITIEGWTPAEQRRRLRS